MSRVRRTSVECSDANFNPRTFETQVETILEGYKSVTNHVNEFLDWFYIWRDQNLNIQESGIEVVERVAKVDGVETITDCYQKPKSHHAHLYMYPLSQQVVTKLRELDELLHHVARENLELKAYTTGIAKNMVESKNVVHPEYIDSVMHNSSATVGNTQIGALISGLNAKILDRMYKMVNLNAITKTMVEEAIIEEVYSDIENEMFSIIQGVEHTRLDLILGTAVTKKSSVPDHTHGYRPGYG